MRSATFTLDEIRLSRPVQHDINRPKAFWQVLEEIHAALKHNKVDFQQGKIYVGTVSAPHGNDKAGQPRKKADILRECTFDKLFTSIIIVDELHEMEGTILLAYNPSGIQLAFGLGYNERSEVALLGEEDTFMSTTACGDVEVKPYFVMIHKVRQWFPVGNRNVLDQLERAKLVMNKSITIDPMLKFVDHYFSHNMKYNDCLANDHLLSTSSFERFVIMLKENIHKEISTTKNYSVWDLYNLGNSILKPEGSFELKEIIPLAYFWGGYVFSRLA